MLLSESFLLFLKIWFVPAFRISVAGLRLSLGKVEMPCLFSFQGSVVLFLVCFPLWRLATGAGRHSHQNTSGILGNGHTPGVAGIRLCALRISGSPHSGAAVDYVLSAGSCKTTGQRKRTEKEHPGRGDWTDMAAHFREGRCRQHGWGRLILEWTPPSGVLTASYGWPRTQWGLPFLMDGPTYSGGFLFGVAANGAAAVVVR